MPRRIPFVDLAQQHAELKDDLDAAFGRVLDASAFILGDEVERFEAEFASYCGVKHCVGVASGTAAITIALKAAGVGRGDEVIVPAHTFVASALGVQHAGATPVLCDVVDGTGLIDLDSAARVVSDRTAALLPVHLYGQACDMDAVGDLADRYGLAVVEDAAQAHGASWRAKRVGSFGTAAAFSFYPSKNLGALGDGGAITTDDNALAEQARMLRNLGQRTKGEHLVPGFNERLDGLQAAILRTKLPHLDRWNDARRRAAVAYREGLAGTVQVLEEQPAGSCVYHLFPIRTLERDALAAHLADEGIQTGVHYSPALHEQPALKPGHSPLSYPVATAWAKEELSLPMFEGLGAAQTRRVTEVCLERLG